MVHDTTIKNLRYTEITTFMKLNTAVLDTKRSKVIFKKKD